ncbi:LysM peptidoglycan-binding domain-containing protein [Fictibacillus nanhaiensis]|uniref:LysM peptidoglycan-binding domain-containing protein n=1 Tax=Fictibacillus nanhaiensis TaxID=742169 RepID=UPI001C97079A|nr:LysM domain-containing protein [Fictibacillus nanhaiensis]MBY6035476.1 LysM peptidoglycan-binding domain-containing protein [Fictibacillus nanhaiensis]
MKRFLTGCTILLILYVVAYDLKIGTLPQAQPAKAQIKTKDQIHKYHSYEVNPGDTLISVVEKLNSNGDYSIISMIKDFKTLNPGVNPESIQIGQTYKFPSYKKAER